MISVIVPVYRVERYLCQCLDSILNQTYPNLEILLVDDGSPDKCGEICEEYAKIDNRIRVFHTENKGLSAARNLGLREAKGEYIGFVDSDDWIEPGMYEILLRRIEETGTNICACGVWKEYQRSKSDYNVCDTIYTGTEAIRALLSNQIGNVVWNKLYKKNCLEGIIFLENANYEEIATVYKIILKAYRVSATHEHLYHYRMRKSSIVHTRTMKNLMDYWFAYYNRYLYLKSLPEFRDDQKTTIILEKQVALATVRIWRWMYRIPIEQRDYDFLLKVSCFMNNNFSFSQKRKWGFLLRIAVFFSKYTNDFSLATFYSLRCLYFSITGINKKEFPS